MEKARDFRFPGDDPDERELLLSWLDYLRGAILRNVHGVCEEDAHRRPDGKLLPLAGIVNHLIGVERRWIDGAMLGGSIYRAEEEFFPGAEKTVPSLVAAYRERAATTDRAVRTLGLDAPSSQHEGETLRWVLLHLINETARHAGHADAVRELIDGATGE
ncbi:MAG: DinB family protein [Acidimicrobiales bacterium]